MDTPEHDDFLAYAGSGDQAALERCLASIAPRAYEQARRYLGDPADAEDAAQEALSAAVRCATRFDPSVPFLAWFGRIVHNRALMVARARGRRRKHEHVVAAAEPASLPAVEVDGELLRLVVHELPATQREAVDLHYFAGLSQDDAARAVGVTVNAFAVRLHRAREALRELLARRGVTAAGTVIAASLALPASADAATLPAGLLVKARSLARNPAQAGKAGTISVGWWIGVAVAALLAVLAAWVWSTMPALDGATASAASPARRAPGADLGPRRPDLPGIIAWWPLDGDQRDVIGGHDAHLADGSLRSAASGSLAHVLEGDHSLALWVRCGTASSASLPLLSRQDAQGLAGLLLGPDGGVLAQHALRGDQGRAEYVGLRSTILLQRGRWTHLAQVVDAAAGHQRLYADGVLAGETAWTPGRKALPLDAGAPWQLGSAGLDIREVVIADRVLDAATLSQVRGFPPR